MADPTKPELSPAEVVERLKLRNESVVDEVYALIKRVSDSDEKRDGALNGKASALLSVTGLSLTLAFTFGGMLVQRTEPAACLGPIWLYGLVVVPYGVAIACGLVASLFALSALRVRSTYRDVDPHEVFGPVLKASDDGNDPTRYKRHLAAHLWRIYDTNYKNHERKAKIIKRGQNAFVGFIFALLPIGVAMTYTIAPHAQATQTPPATSQPAQPPAPSPAAAPPPAPPQSAQPAANPVPSAGRVKTLSQP